MENQSPLPNNVIKIDPATGQVGNVIIGNLTGMSFPEAMKAVIAEKKITRLSWEDLDHYGLLKDGLLALHKAGQDEFTFYSWIVNDGDLLATDWMVVD